MATEAQIIANRQNALKSTGPRSAAGKNEASQNAFRHGVLSKNLLVSNEKLQELECFRENLYSTLSPQGAMEALLVEKIVNAAWRLQRLAKVEAAILGEEGTLYGEKSLKYSFMGSNGDGLLSLSRYESALDRNFYKAIHELQRMQALRLGGAVTVPIAIEISGQMGQ